MSIQPQRTPPGWYAQGTAQRYWDGARWTEHVAPLEHSVQPRRASANTLATPRPRAVSGMTTGQHLVHLVLTVCTCGLWGIVWLLRSRLSRRKIIY